MGIRKIEFEVEYPDCVVCGKCIEEDEQYIELNIGGSISTCHRGIYVTSGIPLKTKRMVICKSCATNPLNDKLKQKLQEKVGEMISGAEWSEK